MKKGDGAMKTKNVFVLSGGSIKGSFQAGALVEILTRTDFHPDAIYGTSVGSLNGAFIADRAGRASRSALSWNDVGRQLEAFWMDQITSFKTIGKKKRVLRLAWDFLTARDQFSFIDMSPLYRLVREQIRRENLLKSPVRFFACAVNMVNGQPVYASASTHPDIIDYVIASSAIPLVMPARKIKSGLFIDGGIREVAPLERAIKENANRIVCVVCQPQKLEKQARRCKNAVDLMNRDMDIVTNETVNNDLERCIQINDILNWLPKKPAAGPLKGKRVIELLDIRPCSEVDLDLTAFDCNQIRRAFEQGWNASSSARKRAKWIKAVL
jgi:NTE family protein